MSLSRTEVGKLVKELRHDLTEMRQSLERELRKEHREIKASLDFMNKAFEDMANQLKKVETENAELKAANSSLTSECALLRDKVTENELRITQLEQYSRNKNIEIKGVPTTQNEKLESVLAAIGNAVDEPVSESDIEVCHRVPTRDASRHNIVVQFHNRSKRNALLEKARKKRVTTADIGHQDRQPIYINEHLCPTLKVLLGKTVAKKNEKNWRFCWTKEGKIFARKNESSRVLRVTKLSDLDKIE